jgi:aryl-alcohol dehydrogenase-like predicted oxidoreductase
MSDSRDPWLAPRATADAPQLQVGVMNFGKRTDRAESERIVERALERGLKFFDTANAYNAGESERILGRALGSRRGECRIASKVGLDRRDDRAEGLSSGAIASAIDATLSRLGTDYVDVYYLHAPDHDTPIEETLDAVHALLDAGKIRHFGVSNYSAWQIFEMNALCDARGMPRPAISQVLYNVLIRELEVEYFAFARRYPIHTAVYNPLAGGLLAGSARRDAGPRAGSRFDANKMYLGRYWTERMFERVDALRPIAEREGLTLVELGYAWIGGRPGVDSILVGPATTAQLDAAFDACRKTLSTEARAAIDELHRADLGTDTHYVR